MTTNNSLDVAISISTKYFYMPNLRKSLGIHNSINNILTQIVDYGNANNFGNDGFAIYYSALVNYLQQKLDEIQLILMCGPDNASKFSRKNDAEIIGELVDFVMSVFGLHREGDFVKK